MKVYLLLHDEDHDATSIYGAYSTEEKAEAARHLFVSCGTLPDVLEMELDREYDVPEGCSGWRVRMHECGEVFCYHRTGPEMTPGQKPAQGFPGQWWFEVWARDIDHAVSIVNEKRVAMIADKAWR